MARHVEFSTADNKGDTDDGMMLRCNEFVRLGQTPRVWPTVNLELLKRLKAAGHRDEGSPDAWKALTALARTFDQDCHGLKRLMAERTQEIALARRGGHKSTGSATEGAYDTPFDLSDVARAIAKQNEAMGKLVTLIAGIRSARDSVPPSTRHSCSFRSRSDSV